MKLKLNFHSVYLYFLTLLSILTLTTHVFLSSLTCFFVKDIVSNHPKGKEKTKANKPQQIQTLFYLLGEGRKGYLNSRSDSTETTLKESLH